MDSGPWPCWSHGVSSPSSGPWPPPAPSTNLSIATPARIPFPLPHPGPFSRSQPSPWVGPGKSAQLISCVQLFCNPMDCSTPGLSFHHQFLELAQTHIRSSWSLSAGPRLMVPTGSSQHSCCSFQAIRSSSLTSFSDSYDLEKIAFEELARYLPGAPVVKTLCFQ